MLVFRFMRASVYLNTSLFIYPCALPSLVTMFVL